MADEIDFDALTAPEPSATEPPPDDKVEGQEEAPPKMVPLAALHEERAARKQLQQELRETQQRLSKVDELAEQLKQMREKPAAPPPPEPEFAEDPQAYIDRQAAKANERTEAELKALREKYQQVEAQTQAQMFQTRLRGIEEAFVNDHDDYYDALGHVRKLRIEELQARGYDEDQIKIKIIQDELELAGEAMGRNKNPAEVAYSRAKAYGYSPKAADAEPAEDDRQARVERAQSMGSSHSKVDVEALMAAPDDVLDEVFRELKFGNKMK